MWTFFSPRQGKTKAFFGLVTTGMGETAARDKQTLKRILAYALQAK